MVDTFVTSILAFAATNIDDIFILTLFYGSRKYSPSTIIAGQFLGIFFLVGISLLASFIGNFVDARYIGLLGFFPIYLSVRQTIKAFQNDDEDGQSPKFQTTKRGGVFAIASVTIANGGDNIGVYVPLLSTFAMGEKLQLVGIFVFMVFLWCYVARYLSRHPLLSDALDKYSHILLPFVLFALGVFILIESRAYTLVS
jgi:cadmium resistance transport/sequestration family protein